MGRPSIAEQAEGGCKEGGLHRKACEWSFISAQGKVKSFAPAAFFFSSVVDVERKRVVVGKL